MLHAIPIEVGATSDIVSTSKLTPSCLSSRFFNKKSKLKLVNVKPLRWFLPLGTSFWLNTVG